MLSFASFVILCTGSFQYLNGATAAIISATGHFQQAAQLQRRVDATGSSELSLQDERDFFYNAPITIGGQQFVASIDTGSSDLWIEFNGNMPKANNTGIVQHAIYGIGTITGPVKQADVDFAGISVKNQAFIQVASADNHGTNFKGLIGLGFNTLSTIFVQAFASDPRGSTLLDNFFLQQPDAPNFITIMLGRTLGIKDPQPGTFTFGEVVQGMESVLDQPRLDLFIAENLRDQRWTAHLDGMSVNGQSIGLPRTTVANNTDPSRLIAVFDTGFTFPQFPQQMVDAMYKDVPGAKLESFFGGRSQYVLPCNIPVNVTFTFGGKAYPMHPLDMSIDTGLGGGMCSATFQIRTSDGELVDFVAGMAFLRSVYMLNNYGDFINGDVRTVDKPYIQLLSTVDTSKMYNEFYGARNSQTSSGNTVSSASTIDSITNATPISTFASVAGVATSSSPSPNSVRATSITGTKPSSSLEASASTLSPIKTNGSIPAARGSLIKANVAILMMGLSALFGLL